MDYEDHRDRRKLKGGAAPLGQHLLTNTKVAAAVADAAGVKHGTNVYEVGPGKGILTAELLARGAVVKAVEKDPQMIEYLDERFMQEIKSGQLTVYFGDAREIGPDVAFPRVPYVVAANIPYYITGELIRIALTARHQPDKVALLVQKEVAERIARSKKESILSLSVKLFGIPKYVTTVKRGNFNPPPKVDSAILAIDKVSRKNLRNVDEDRFFTLIKIAFGQKRKTLLGNITRAAKVEPIEDDYSLTTAGEKASAVLHKHYSEKKAQMMRAEDVPLELWLQMLAD